MGTRREKRQDCARTADLRSRPTARWTVSGRHGLVKGDGGRVRVQGRARQVTEGNLRQSASKGIGNNLPPMYVSVAAFSLSHHSPSFHQGYRIWGRNCSVRNSGTVQILKHKTISYNLSNVFPPSSPWQECGWREG